MKPSQSKENVDFPFSKRTSYHHRWSFVSSEMYIKCHMICNPCNASDTVRCEWLRENWCRQTHRRPVFRSHGRYTIQLNGQFFLETQRSETDSNEIPISPNPNVNIRTNAIFYFMSACLLHEKINTFFDGKISEYKYYLRDGERTVQWKMLLRKMCTLYTVFVHGVVFIASFLSDLITVYVRYFYRMTYFWIWR